MEPATATALLAAAGAAQAGGSYLGNKASAKIHRKSAKEVARIHSRSAKRTTKLSAKESKRKTLAQLLDAALNRKHETKKDEAAASRDLARGLSEATQRRAASIRLNSRK